MTSMDTVVHWAAPPGVRASAERPMACAQADLLGFASVLEAGRRTGEQRLLNASSSGVDGRHRGQLAQWLDRWDPVQECRSASTC